MKNNIILKFAFLLALLLPSLSFGQNARPPVNGNVNLPSNGITIRVQLPDVAVSACSFIADSANVGMIFFGGPTVTNAGGTNKGIPLLPGVGIFNVTMTNLRAAFFSTATNNNKVAWTCN